MLNDALHFVLELDSYGEGDDSFFYGGVKLNQCSTVEVEHLQRTHDKHYLKGAFGLVMATAPRSRKLTGPKTQYVVILLTA